MSFKILSPIIDIDWRLVFLFLDLTLSNLDAFFFVFTVSSTFLYLFVFELLVCSFMDDSVLFLLIRSNS